MPDRTRSRRCPIHPHHDIRAIRRQVGREAIDDIESARVADTHEVLVALTKPLDKRRERSLVSLAADLVRADDGRVVVVRFEAIPDQAPLTGGATAQSAADRSFERRIASLADDLKVDLEADEVVSHDTKHAVVNFADRRGVDTVVAEHEPLRLRSRLFGNPVDWIVRHAPCDVLLVDNLGYDNPTEVILAGDGGPYPPAAVNVAERVAAANDGRVSLWFSDENDGTDRRRTIEDYQSELSSLLSVPVRPNPVRTDGGLAYDPDLLVRRGADDRLRDVLFNDRPVFPAPGCTAVTVYPHETSQPPFARRLLERVAF